MSKTLYSWRNSIVLTSLFYESKSLVEKRWNVVLILYFNHGRQIDSKYCSEETVYKHSAHFRRNVRLGIIHWRDLKRWPTFWYPLFVRFTIIRNLRLTETMDIHPAVLALEALLSQAPQVVRTVVTKRETEIRVDLEVTRVSVGGECERVRG